MRHYETCACNFTDLFDSRVIYEKASVESIGFYRIESFGKIMHEADITFICEELVRKSEEVPEHYLVKHDDIKGCHLRRRPLLLEQS